MYNPMFDVGGKIVLITGSGRGLGLTYAKGYLKAGATVILNDVVEETLKEVVAGLREEGYNAYGYCFDVSDENSVKDAVARIEAEVGPIGVLINNAGIHRRAPLAEMSAADWRKVIDVNLTSAFLVGQAVAQGMIARKKGKIINITSLNAVLARTNIANYSSAKGGLTMLTKSMATEWGRFGVTCNAIGPGYIKTDLTKPLVEDPEFNSWVVSEVPLGRWGDPEDIVGTAIFLGSPASDYINGYTIFVDGGWQACL